MAIAWSCRTSSGRLSISRMSCALIATNSSALSFSRTSWLVPLTARDWLAGGHIRQQRVRAFQIMGLAWRQDEVQRIAQRIDKRMNLGAQPAFAAPDRLVFGVVFCGPAR